MGPHPRTIPHPAKRLESPPCFAETMMGFSILAVLGFASSPTEDTEVFIAGGGIAGLSTARALALRGIKAIVAEQNGLCVMPSATKGAAQGHVYTPYGEPGSDSDSLRTKSREIYESIQNRTDIEYVATGSSHLAFTDETSLELEILATNEQIARYPGKAMLYINSTGIDSLGLKAARAGAWQPTTAAVDPCRALLAMRQDVEDSGGAVLENAGVTAIAYDQDGSRYHVTLADGRRITAAHAVLALGIWHDAFLRDVMRCGASQTAPSSIAAVAGQIQIFETDASLSETIWYVYGMRLHPDRVADGILDKS